MDHLGHPGYLGPFWATLDCLGPLLPKNLVFQNSPQNSVDIILVDSIFMYNNHAPPCPPDEREGLHSSALLGWHPLHI